MKNLQKRKLLVVLGSKREMLAAIGCPTATRWEHVADRLKELIVGARKANDDKLAAQLSEVKATLKKRLPHTCMREGCGIAIGSDGTWCNLHNVQRLAAILLVFCTTTLLASTFILSWNPSEVSGFPGFEDTSVTNYIVYVSERPLTESNKTNALLQLNVGTNLSANLSNLPPVFFYAVEAQNDLSSSGLSEVLQFGGSYIETLNVTRILVQ